MNMALFGRTDTSPAATLSNSQRATGCVAYDPLALEPTYGYDPSLAPGIVFTVAFFLSLTAHTVQTIQSRKWWYSTFALGALGMWYIVLGLNKVDRLTQGGHWLGWTCWRPSLPIQQDSVLSSDLHPYHL